MQVKKFFDYLYEAVKQEFQIGDKVACYGTQDAIMFNGEVGTIIKARFYGLYGVKFDNRFSNYLHDCNGLDITRSSYNISPDLLTLNDPTKKKFIKILMDVELVDLLKKIGESKVAQMYLDLYDRKIETDDLKKDYVSYLNIENDSTISFLKQRYWLEGDPWHTKRRDSMKANRVLRLIVTDKFFEDNIKPADIELFSNKLAALFKPLEVLELRGDDMLRAFNYTREMNMKLFANSCANFHQKEWGGEHAEPQKSWYDIYTKNPKNMAVIVALKNGRIVGRKTIQQGLVVSGKKEGKIYTYVGNYYGEGGWTGKECMAIDAYINKTYPLNSGKGENYSDYPVIKIENTKFPHYPPFDSMMVNPKDDQMSMNPPPDNGWYSCYKARFPEYDTDEKKEEKRVKRELKELKKKEKLKEKE